MYPNNPQNYQPQPQPPLQPQQDFSVDYLNQISQGAQTGKKPNPKFLFMIIGIALVAVVLFVAMMAFSSGGGNIDKAPDLYMRLNALKETSEKYHDYIRDTDLRAANSSYTLLLTDALRDIEAPFKALGVNLKEVSKDKKLKALQEEYTKELDGELNEAKLLVLLDRTYAREMAFQVRGLKTLMTSLNKSSKSQAVTGYVDNLIPNFTEVENTFANFTDTK